VNTSPFIEFVLKNPVIRHPRQLQTRKTPPWKSGDLARQCRAGGQLGHAELFFSNSLRSNSFQRGPATAFYQACLLAFGTAKEEIARMETARSECNSDNGTPPIGDRCARSADHGRTFCPQPAPTGRVSRARAATFCRRRGGAAPGTAPRPMPGCTDGWSGAPTNRRKDKRNLNTISLCHHGQPSRQRRPNEWQTRHLRCRSSPEFVSSNPLLHSLHMILCYAYRKA
jgi:hypothetical protein